MTSPSPTAQRRVDELVAHVVGEYVSELQRGYLDDHSVAVAALAQLRRGAGKLIQDVPDLWGVCGIERLYADEDGLHHNQPEHVQLKAENAMFLAVTLYALHQQSHSKDRMHRPGVGLGTAVRRLMPEHTIDEPIRRRFVRLGTATDLEALAYRLREIVSLLRREAIPLDYALLASQLYQAQFPDGLRQVRRQWGRSFHTYRTESSSNGEVETVKDDR
ncbi:MAG: type I-E CRISPR-associated protein Cse2/CasB [Sphaerobacter thermophilus]|jgi:CRISPR system Cascade subunit CasB|uniref:type I-E CRISPR-associated protein Cse2/CasB n=1 Tax=uncultured Thermomonospora sp. TaxID=671175 RepID=UPI000DB2A1D0|nr:type I-E CRISPR-associated protein Cse2/CasB [uncultured Thermomonospora sp.]PZN41640.1 MAG: type I-E CRISPR-associated protein Cse2/CasB [Actinomycetota bacterium]